MDGTRPIHLLLIEDDTDSADAMRSLLRRQGVDVDWAASGKEAVAFFEQGAPTVDVILLDLMLPDMDGSDLIRQLARTTDLPPIVIHSAASQAELLRSAGELHPVAILQKPTDWVRLREILESCRPAANGQPG